MGLVKAKESVPINYTSPIAAKINQRRRQILVHSYIYYQLDTNIISDHTWSMWAMELVQLQKDYPDIAAKVAYAKEFETFDGSSGYYLPYNTGNLPSIGRMLVRIEEEDKQRREIKKDAKPTRCTLV